MAGQAPEHATEALAQPQLDEETGEMVSKRELKKRQQKRARKAATAAARAEKPNDRPKQQLQKQEKTDDMQVDPDAMFTRGFLADVYNELPAEHVVTRFPPEPNGFLHLGHVKAIAVDLGFARYHGEQLIELGKAYVCRYKDSEIKRQRGGHEGKEGPRYRCDHSQQDVSTNLVKFRMMRDGKYEPQTASYA
ncbi:glutaminyl-tRNA synthetase, partial [Metarhizium majus ARSEF 297]